MSQNDFLPDEILHQMMQFADNHSLVSCTLVNKKWNYLSTLNSLWKDQGRFLNAYGDSNVHYPNYRKFVSQTKKQTFEYCKEQEANERSEERKKTLKKIGVAILALFCPPVAGCITKNIIDDYDDIYADIGSLICLGLVFIGTCCFWIPGIIMAWIYIYSFDLKDENSFYY